MTVRRDHDQEDERLDLKSVLHEHRIGRLEDSDAKQWDRINEHHAVVLAVKVAIATILAVIVGIGAIYNGNGLHDLFAFFGK